MWAWTRGRVLGVPGGWRDPWDEPDDHAELRARAEAIKRRQMQRAELLGVVWRAQIAAEQTRQRRGGVGYQHHGAA
jgi:hypothetical protein